MKFNLSKFNAIAIAVCVLIIIVGFILMIGEPSGPTEFNEDIFSARRITVGPMIALLGFVLIIPAILYKPRKK
jgi:hypothetical protein